MSDPIRAAVVEAIGERYGEGVDIAEWHGPKTRRWSWHVEITLRGGQPSSLLLKIPRWEGAPTLEAALAHGSQASTVAEAESLASLAHAVRRSRDPGLTAADVIAYLPSINGILMERLVARPLRHRLGRGNPRAIDAVIARVGRLVRVFHTRGDVERRRMSGAEEAERVTRLAESGPGSLRAWAERLVSAAKSIDGTDEPVGMVHGDLNLDNVLVDAADRVALIDPNSTVGPLLADVALLVGDMRLDRRQLLTGGLARGRSRCAQWEESLMEESGLSDEPARAFRQATELIARWSRLESEASGARRLALPLARRMLAGSLKRRFGALGE